MGLVLEFEAEVTVFSRELGRLSCGDLWVDSLFRFCVVVVPEVEDLVLIVVCLEAIVVFFLFFAVFWY